MYIMSVSVNYYKSLLYFLTSQRHQRSTFRQRVVKVYAARSLTCFQLCWKKI